MRGGEREEDDESEKDGTESERARMRAGVRKRRIFVKPRRRIVTLGIVTLGFSPPHAAPPPQYRTSR